MAISLRRADLQPTTWRRLRAWWEDRRPDVNVRAWVGASVTLMAIGAIIEQPILAVLGAVIGIVGVALRLWWDWALAKLTYTRSFETTRAFWGTDIGFELTAENAKPMPIARLDVIEDVSMYMDIPGLDLPVSAESRNRLLETIFTLGMYERVTHRYTMRARRRGWYRFGPTQVTARDPFGMVSRRTTLEDRESVLVYPRLVPMTPIEVPARQPLGDMKPATPLVEDPMRMAGSRPYVAGDSPKRIHWRATARTGELQTRVYEASATPVVSIFLDTITFSHLWEGQDSNLLETSVMVAATLSRDLLEGRHQVGMYVNAPIPGITRSIRISPGRSSGQLSLILEKLAMIQPAFSEHIEDMLTKELRRMPWGASIVLITSKVTPRAQRVLLRMARSGGAKRIVVIAMGEEPELVAEFRRRFTVYHVSAEEKWDEVDRLTLTRIT